MKSSIRTIALAAIVAIASLSQTMHAQTVAYASRVHVPFSFDYGTQHFSAGTYAISMQNASVLAVRTSGRTAFAIVQVDSGRLYPNTGSVIFRKYGDRYFLEEYRPAGSNTVIKVYESQAERRATREFASLHSQPTLVELALLSPPALNN